MTGSAFRWGNSDASAPELGYWGWHEVAPQPQCQRGKGLARTCSAGAGPGGYLFVHGKVDLEAFVRRKDLLKRLGHQDFAVDQYAILMIATGYDLTVITGVGLDLVRVHRLVLFGFHLSSLLLKGQSFGYVEQLVDQVLELVVRFGLTAYPVDLVSGYPDRSFLPVDVALPDVVWALASGPTVVIALRVVVLLGELAAA